MTSKFFFKKKKKKEPFSAVRMVQKVLSDNIPFSRVHSKNDEDHDENNEGMLNHCFKNFLDKYIYSIYTAKQFNVKKHIFLKIVSNFFDLLTN